MTIDYGTLIRTRRKEMGITQTELANRLDITRQNLCAYERGGRDMRLGTFLRILNELYLKIDIVEDRPWAEN